MNGTPQKKKKVMRIIVLAAFVFLSAGPLFLNAYWLRVLTLVFMFAIMAEAWNIVGGYCGCLSLGNVVFFGLGAYTTCIFMTVLHQPFWLGLLCGAILCAIYATILGLPVLRLKGQYFAIATLGVAEGTRELITNLEITNGAEGISLPIVSGEVQNVYSMFYLLMFGIMVGVILFTLWMSKRRLGYSFKAIRADEGAALAAGINTALYKTIAWSISGFVTGLTGGIYAYWTNYINPDTVFNVGITVKMLVMVVLGGMGTVLGPIAGAFVFEFLSEVVWSSFVNIHGLILSLVIILVVIFIPGGFIRFLSSRFSLSSLLVTFRGDRI